MGTDKTQLAIDTHSILSATDPPQFKQLHVWTCVIEAPAHGTRIKHVELQKSFDDLWENKGPGCEFFLFNCSSLQIAAEDGTKRSLVIKEGHYVVGDKGVYVPLLQKRGFMWVCPKKLTSDEKRCITKICPNKLTSDENRYITKPLHHTWIPSFLPFSTRFEPPVSYDLLSERARAFCSVETPHESNEPKVAGVGLATMACTPKESVTQGRVYGKMFDVVLDDVDLAGLLQTACDRLGIQTLHQLTEFCRSLKRSGDELLTDLGNLVDFDSMDPEVYQAFMFEYDNTQMQEAEDDDLENDVVSTEYFKFKAQDPKARYFMKSVCKFFKFTTVDKLRDFIEANKPTSLALCPALGYSQLSKEARSHFVGDETIEAVDDNKYGMVKTDHFVIKVRGTKMAAFLQKACDEFGIDHIERLQSFVLSCAVPRMDLELNNMLNVDTHRHMTLKRRKEEFENMQGYATKIAMDNQRMKIELDQANEKCKKMRVYFNIIKNEKEQLRNELEKAQQLLQQYESNKEHLPAGFMESNKEEDVDPAFMESDIC